MKNISKHAVSVLFCTIAIIPNWAFAQTQCNVIGVHIPGSDIYNGPTTCKKMDVASLTVRGPLKLVKTTVSGTIELSGPLTASQSELQDIILMEQFRPVKLKLTDHTVVKGTIRFQGKPGVIHLDKSSEINGEVVNGTVLHD